MSLKDLLEGAANIVSAPAPKPKKKKLSDTIGPDGLYHEEEETNTQKAQKSVVGATGGE